MEHHNYYFEKRTVFTRSTDLLLLLTSARWYNFDGLIHKLPIVQSVHKRYELYTYALPHLRKVKKSIFYSGIVWVYWNSSEGVFQSCTNVRLVWSKNRRVRVKKTLPGTEFFMIKFPNLKIPMETIIYLVKNLKFPQKNFPI